MIKKQYYILKKNTEIWRKNMCRVTLPCFSTAMLVALVIILSTFANGGTRIENQSAKLTFNSKGKGEYVFNTGVLRGKLRPDGKSLGLSSVIHIPSGVQLNGRYGIFSYYRIFTTNKRYGHAAWDRPSVSKLLPDGAVEVVWPEGTEYPFEITVVYRLKDETTLDIETTIKARKDLHNFEVFLASYFNESFPAPYIYAYNNPETKGKPGFMMAQKSFGNWQMFPRDKNVLQIIHDGRWQKEPNPVKWVIMPYLAAPICVRRGDTAELTAILMAPPQDCFAIATPYQGESHYSLYMSLVGRDVKAGEVLKSHCRLVIAPNLSDKQILDLYRKYIEELETG
jgi:hypothetical protein